MQVCKAPIERGATRQVSVSAPFLDWNPLELLRTNAKKLRLTQAQNYFNHFDKDRSGVLSKQEFLLLHAGLLTWNVSQLLLTTFTEDLMKHKYKIPSDPAVALAHVDKDGSGQVSFNEFTAWLGIDSL